MKTQLSFTMASFAAEIVGFLLSHNKEFNTCTVASV